ncbi:g1824 [Coccomyxa viridis]|uniref:G1824 protein n=1 Tax=Coccomyxa viridis TaxID=1274662 RepID=A0ABP1FL33_9CHLO
MGDRRALLISLVGIGLGAAAVSKLLPQSSTSSSRRQRTTGKDDPWTGPMREAMESDVVEEDGEVVVRMSTGNWYFLREDPDNRKAFILEGGFGDRYRLQTDKPVRTFSLKMLQRIFSRHDLWERRLVRLQ